ncbi:conserved hypothetical protein [Clostridioides difficile T17]|nr:conserved hypothetical protein [Clostridioides difficile T17]
MLPYISILLCYFARLIINTYCFRGFSLVLFELLNKTTVI